MGVTDHVGALEDGQIRARGTPEEVVTEGLLADVFGVEAVVSVEDHGPRITPLAPIEAGEAPASGRSGNVDASVTSSDGPDA